MPTERDIISQVEQLLMQKLHGEAERVIKRALDAARAEERERLIAYCFSDDGDGGDIWSDTLNGMLEARQGVTAAVDAANKALVAAIRARAKEAGDG